MKKGITIITLAVMIVIMIIITTTVTITGAKTINNSKKIKFASELVVIKEAIEDYAVLNAGKLPLNETPDSEGFYEVNMSILKNIETLYGRGIYGEDDVYLYNKSSKEVKYKKGIEIAGVTYNTLNEELKNIINLNDEIKVRDGIIFEKTPNTEEYINQAITVTIKIPDSYTNITVLSQNSVVSAYTQENHYYVYTVTKSSNFNVVVNYTKEEQTLRQVYLVSNFDNEEPSISITGIDTITADGETKKSIKLSVTDNLSGIDKIMYEVGDYEDIDESYFDTRGYNVYNNNVIVDRTVDKVTFYAVDKAGNSCIKYTDENFSATTSTDDYVKYGLILHYDGINNTGSGHSATATLWKDLSGHGNDGILKGGQWLRNSLKFDDSFVDIGIKNYENITLEIVVSHDSLSSGEVDYIDNFEGCGYGITYNSSHSLKNEMWIYNSNNNWIKVTSNTNVELDKKYSLSGSYDGHTLYLYDNGVKYYNSHEGTIKHKSNIPIFIGANPSSDGKNGSEFLNGKVYSVRIYNRALTEEEVIQNYNVDKARFGI